MMVFVFFFSVLRVSKFSSKKKKLYCINAKAIISEEKKKKGIP